MILGGSLVVSLLLGVLRSLVIRLGSTLRVWILLLLGSVKCAIIAHILILTKLLRDV